MARTFDTGKHARAIRGGGVPAPAADAIVDVIAEATDSLVTDEFLRNELAQMEERMTARLDLGIERLQNEMVGQTERLRNEMANQTAQLRTEMAEQAGQLRTEMANTRAEMWRAMYLSVGVMAAIAGIALAIAELF